MNGFKNLSRRDLLRAMGLTGAYASMASPLTMLLESLVLGITQKAHGATNDKKYLLCLLAGAPPRWTMDLFLNPYDAAAFTPNLCLGTKYVATNGRYTNTTYATIQRTDYKGRAINVPYMWQFPVPKYVAGNPAAERPMDELLKHMVQLRGIDVNQSQHQAAQSLHMHPLGAKQSLTAVAADNGTAYIPGIDLSVGEYKFASVKGLTSVRVPDGGDMVQTLMSPFVDNAGKVATFKTNRAAMASVVENATKALDALAKSKDPKAEALADNRREAQFLLENGIAGIGTYWTATVARYQSLIDRCIKPTRKLIPGIDDLPVGTTDVANRTGIYRMTDVPVDEPDLRNIIKTSTVIRQMAEHFAVAQFVLTNNISNSVAMSPDSMRGFVTTSKTNLYLNMDEHLTGGMVSLMFNTHYNRALAACMLELIDQLKAKNMFQNTVIDVCGEFGRSTRSDGTGSDHGFRGGNTALYTGAVTKGPIVIGNIVKDASKITGSDSHGSWGSGAPYVSLKENLHAGHMAATIAYLLNAPSPVTSASSLVKTTADGIVPVFDELPKQV